MRLPSVSLAAMLFVRMAAGCAQAEVMGASLTGVAQCAHVKGFTDCRSTARADVEVELPLNDIGALEGRLYAHVRAGEGDGVTPSSFAAPNASVFGNTRPVLMQAWYQLGIPVGSDSGRPVQVEVTIGKIDPFGFFDGNAIADDESESFLNLAFVHNPLLDAGGDLGVGRHGTSPGVRVAYVGEIKGVSHFSASLGLFAAGRNAEHVRSFGKPLTIAQLEYAGRTWSGLEGAYRLYAWQNAQAFDQTNDVDANGAFDDVPQKHQGWGISFDQKISDGIALFARHGHSSCGTLAFDRAFTLGGQISGKAWARGDDRLGMAWGVLKTSDAYRAAGQGRGSERIAEVFYAWQVREFLQITPSYQRIGNASGSGDDVSIWGLRVKASY